MDPQYRNKSQLFLPGRLSLRYALLNRFSSLEIINLTEQELTSLGFLGPSELLSSLHRHVHLAHS